MREGKRQKICIFSRPKFPYLVFRHPEATNVTALGLYSWTRCTYIKCNRRRTWGEKKDQRSNDVKNGGGGSESVPVVVVSGKVELRRVEPPFPVESDNHTN